MPQQHELRLPARCRAERLDALVDGEAGRRSAIEDRHRRRPFDALRFKFRDGILERSAVSPGPAGDHQMIDLNIAPRRPGLTLKHQRQNTRRHTKPPGDIRRHSWMQSDSTWCKGRGNRATAIPRMVCFRKLFGGSRGAEHGACNAGQSIYNKSGANRADAALSATARNRNTSYARNR